MIKRNQKSVQLRIGYIVVFEQLMKNVGNHKSVHVAVDQVLDDDGEHIGITCQVKTHQVNQYIQKIIGKNGIKEEYKGVCNVNTEVVNNITGLLDVSVDGVVIVFVCNLDKLVAVLVPVIVLVGAGSFVDVDCVFRIIRKYGFRKEVKNLRFFAFRCLDKKTGEKLVENLNKVFTAFTGNACDFINCVCGVFLGSCDVAVFILHFFRDKTSGAFRHVRLERFAECFTDQVFNQGAGNRLSNIKKSDNRSKKVVQEELYAVRGDEVAQRRKKGEQELDRLLAKRIDYDEQCVGDCGKGYVSALGSIVLFRCYKCTELVNGKTLKKRIDRIFITVIALERKCAGKVDVFAAKQEVDNGFKRNHYACKYVDEGSLLVFEAGSAIDAPVIKLVAVQSVNSLRADVYRFTFSIGLRYGIACCVGLGDLLCSRDSVCFVVPKESALSVGSLLVTEPGLSVNTGNRCTVETVVLRVHGNLFLFIGGYGFLDRVAFCVFDDVSVSIGLVNLRGVGSCYIIVVFIVAVVVCDVSPGSFVRSRLGITVFVEYRIAVFIGYDVSRLCSDSRVDVVGKCGRGGALCKACRCQVETCDKIFDKRKNRCKCAAELFAAEETYQKTYDRAHHLIIEGINLDDFVNKILQALSAVTADLVEDCRKGRVFFKHRNKVRDSVHDRAVKLLDGSSELTLCKLRAFYVCFVCILNLVEGQVFEKHGFNIIVEEVVEKNLDDNVLVFAGDGVKNGGNGVIDLYTEGGKKALDHVAAEDGVGNNLHDRIRCVRFNTLNGASAGGFCCAEVANRLHVGNNTAFFNDHLEQTGDLEAEVSFKVAAGFSVLLIDDLLKKGFKTFRSKEGVNQTVYAVNRSDIVRRHDLIVDDLKEHTVDVESDKFFACCFNFLSGYVVDHVNKGDKRSDKLFNALRKSFGVDEEDKLRKSVDNCLNR